MAPPTHIAAPGRRSRGLVVAVVALAVTCAALASYVGYTFVRPAPASQGAATFVTPTTPPATTPAAAPSTSPPPAALPTSFATARQLVDALNANGLPCGPVDVVANPSLAETLIDCGPTIVVGTYASHSDAEGAFTVLASALAGTNSKVHMAIGSNWTVSAGDAAYAQRAATLFSGVYRST